MRRINSSQKGASKTGNRRRRPPKKRSEPALRRLSHAATSFLRNQHLRIRAGALFVGAMVAGFYGYRMLVDSDVFEVSEIHVEGQRAETVDAAQKKLQVLLGQNSYRMRLADISRALELDPWIAQAEVQRHHGNQIKVELTTEAAKAAVQLGGIYLVNGEGEIFKRSKSSDPALEGLVLITGLSRKETLTSPQKSQARIQEALELINFYQEDPKRPRLSNVGFSKDEGYSLTTYEEAVYVALGTGNLEELEKRIALFDEAWRALPPDDQMAVRTMRVAGDATRVTVAFKES